MIEIKCTVQLHYIKKTFNTVIHSIFKTRTNIPFGSPDLNGDRNEFIFKCTKLYSKRFT